MYSQQPALPEYNPSSDFSIRGLHIEWHKTIRVHHNNFVFENQKTGRSQFSIETGQVLPHMDKEYTF